MAGCGSYELGCGWARARLRALSRVYKGSSSLCNLIAANACLMGLDDCGATSRRPRLTCAWSCVRFRACTGAF